MAGLAATDLPADLPPLQLAWLGDAVWELHQRRRQCHRPGRPQDLHRAVVGRVRAAAQAEALQRLGPLLREHELDLVRRGRNRAGRGPRGGDPALYGQATGFETMLGWLFLRDPQRLAELLDAIESPQPPSPPDGSSYPRP
ncbi:MAG: ribonuclease III domain-containing protein [Synechococcaceae cyanobacterium]|nr:ribonuclease III domain-containing protein [Synechococcaceae cyanobacterium]